jgi:hypothetical protein
MSRTARTEIERANDGDPPDKAYGRLALGRDFEQRHRFAPLVCIAAGLVRPLAEIQG